MSDVARFLRGYAEQAALPYRYSTRWLASEPLELVSPTVAITARDSLGDPTRGVVAHIGRSPVGGWHDVLGDRPLLVRIPDVTDSPPGFTVEEVYTGLSTTSAAAFRRALDPGLGVRACSLAERPDLLAAAGYLADASLPAPLPPGRLESLVATNPLWSPEELFLAATDDEVVGMVRLTSERDRDGTPFVFVRSLATRDRGGIRSISVLAALLARGRAHLERVDARAVHCEVDRAHRGLARLYRLLGFRPSTTTVLASTAP